MPSAMVKLKMSPRKRKMLTIGELDIVEEVLSVMVSRERSYRCEDYLSTTRWQSTTMKTKGGSSIDEYCREQICEWTYRVVDYFHIDREIVSVSLNYLDRFLCSCPCDRIMFKLAATTALYMAVKVVHPQKLGDLGILSDLSRGEFDMKDVANMEEHMLKGLEWKLHPPTSDHYVVIILDCLQIDLPPHETEGFYSNSSFFSELSVCDYFFSTRPASTIALACILNALEGMMYDTDAVILEKALRLQIPAQELGSIRDRLWELYERSEECALHNHSRPIKAALDIQTLPMHTDSNLSPSSSPVSFTSERCKSSEYWPTTVGNSLRDSTGSW